MMCPQRADFDHKNQYKLMAKKKLRGSSLPLCTVNYILFKI